MEKDKLEVIKEETKNKIILGKKLLSSFAIVNIVVSLISWFFNIYTFPFALISILLSLAIFLLSFAKVIWLINALYQAYWYLALLFSMIDGEWNFTLGVLSILIIGFNIISTIMIFFSEEVDEYLYERKTTKR